MKFLFENLDFEKKIRFDLYAAPVFKYYLSFKYFHTFKILKLLILYIFWNFFNLTYIQVNFIKDYAVTILKFVFVVLKMIQLEI